MNAHAPDLPTAGDRLLPWRLVKDLAGINRTTAWRLCNIGRFPTGSKSLPAG